MLCNPCGFGKHIGIPFDAACACSCHEPDRLKQRAEQAERERDEDRATLADLHKQRDYWQGAFEAATKERDEARAKVERLTAAARKFHEETEHGGQCAWGFDCPLCAALEDK